MLRPYTGVWRATVASAALLATAGCATTGSDNPQAAKPVSQAYRYALIDTGANPPGTVGLGDEDSHFYPYVYAAPGVGIADYDDPRLSGSGVWIYPGVIYGGAAGYPSSTSTGSSGPTSAGTATTAPTRQAPRVRTESRRPSSSAPARRSTSQPQQVRDSRR